MHQAGVRSFVCAKLLALVLLLPRPAAAAWPIDPLVNVPLCTAARDQDHSASISDGAGGAIVAWVDYRSGAGDIYAQRISATGAVLWTANGVALCTATGDQSGPTIVADSSAAGEAGSGAIVIWQDGRSGTYDIYAQRISAAGTIQWSADGVALCTATGNQWGPAVVPDGGAPGEAGSGAIAVWLDQRSGSNDDIYAQRILADGEVQWAADGVALCTAAGSQENVTIATDGGAPGEAGSGAIVAWDDIRTGSYDIYVQRISGAGVAQWTADGVALCSATGGQYAPAIVADHASGAIVTWFDQRGGDYDIYAQRILAGGAIGWAAGGVALCTGAGEQYYPVIVTDGGAPGEGGSGAIVAWFDTRSGDNDIYAQRISSAGAVQWMANGVALCTATSTQWYPAIVADGAGGAIVGWTDSRNPTDDIYAQRISMDGAPQWTADGVALCSADGWQALGAIVTNGGAGAIATWVDGRNGSFDIYAQRVLADGTLGSPVGVSDEPAPALAFALDPVRPNPSRGGALTVRFTLASEAAASLELLDIAGRRIAVREVGSLGAGRHTFDLGQGQPLAPGLYLVRLRQGASTRVTRVAVLR
jgi:hypothetical protein